jgi:hypothetical protein
MAVYKQAKSKYWWYKFTWNGKAIRQNAKQNNKRVAEQMEAAHRTALAKGEVGIRDKTPVPTLKDFAEHDFLPFARSTFAAKPKTLTYYENGVSRLLAFKRLAGAVSRCDHELQGCRVRNGAPGAKGKRGGLLSGESEP